MKLIEKKESLVKQLYAYKKINIKEEVMTPVITELLENIDYINSLPRDSKWVGDCLMEDIAIPTSLKDLFYPNSVTLNGKHSDVDYLERVKVKGTFHVWTLRDWNANMATIFGWFKKDMSQIQTIPLSDIRKDLTFGEITYSYQGKVHGEIPATNGYIPVSIKFSDLLLADENQMFEDHLIDKIANSIATKSRD